MSTLVDFINNTPDKDKLLYLSVVVGSLWFFNTAYKPELSFIVGITVAVVYTVYHKEAKEKDVDDLNIQIHYKLNSLLRDEKQSPPKYFYMDADVINFFYSIRDYRVYNRDTYVKAIKTTDKLLMLQNDLENDFEYIPKSKTPSWQNFGYVKTPTKTTNIKNYKEIFEMAEILGTKAVNYVYSFVISLPAGIEYKDKFQTSAERFHIIIKRIIDNILRHAKARSSDPLIGQFYGLPKPFRLREEGVQKFNIIV
jgi:hypothetical protein